MNKLITIGFLGMQTCYLNITKEEAIRRYAVEQQEDLADEAAVNRAGYRILEFEFNDSFEAYDVWQ